MPDIEMRFNRDMLVISAETNQSFIDQGVLPEKDKAFLNLIEPDTIKEILRLENMSGAQCLVANTAEATRARLRHVGLEQQAQGIIHAAIEIAQSLVPQHLLVEVGPCGLPLDPTSKTSLRANFSEYEDFARNVRDESFDALFLNGFRRIDDLRCALMGVRKCYDGPVIASVVVDDQAHVDGKEQETLSQACSLMAEYGADVIGFETKAGPEYLKDIVREAAESVELPILSQLDVISYNPKAYFASKENPYYSPDCMCEAVRILHNEGVQFLRAGGACRPSYTGALVASSIGTLVKGH